MMENEGHGIDHTFVVPAYGCSPFLGACLASLTVQNKRSPIVITTSTPSAFIDKLAARYDVPVVINSSATGIAGDWNFALTTARTRFVTLAHQDDVYNPEYSNLISSAFLDRQGSLCFTDYEEIDDMGHSVISKISLVKHGLAVATLGRRLQPSTHRMRSFLAFGNPLPCSTVTFDLNRLADFRFSSHFASNLDWDAWWRLLDYGDSFLYVPQRLVGRRHNTLTATAGLIADGRRRVEDLAMFRRIWPYPFGEIIATIYRLGY